jgi:hypothetical protein
MQISSLYPHRQHHCKGNVVQIVLSWQSDGVSSDGTLNPVERVHLESRKSVLAAQGVGEIRESLCSRPLLSLFKCCTHLLKRLEMIITYNISCVSDFSLQW